ncbi:chorion protein S15 [Drosophila ficusphila]|uniref:chorion protein S15 n=1 Tax=Drosophila ficusphila TaxID=30025 RepID=UPI001C8A235A|nr:chorion protein S15 [Drosophila ficusphila]
MKYLMICVSLALFAYINALPNPSYGLPRGGYGGGYGHGPVQRVVYEEVPVYGRGGYGVGRPLRSEGNGGSAAAAAAASAAAVNPGSYSQWVVPSWEIDGGRGHPVGHGGY